MNPIVKNIIAVIVAGIIGMLVNGGLVMIGHAIFPLPEGVDGNNMEQLKEAMKSFTFKDYIFPFIAHAGGTLAAAFTAAKLAVSHKMKFALAFGVFFLIGGIAMVSMMSAPMWFNVLDLVAAYIPMAWLGGKLAGEGKPIVVDTDTV